MILKEYEAKELLHMVGLKTPNSVLVFSDFDDQLLAEIEKNLTFPVMVKAQVLHGNRKLSGLVQKAESKSELQVVLTAIFNKKDNFGQPILECLVEEMASFTQELYLAINYSTRTRGIQLSYSAEGGVGMDDKEESITTVPVSITGEVTDFTLDSNVLPVVQKLHNLFLQQDAKLIEINPLVHTQKGFVCLDAKIELDELAKFRQSEWSSYGARTQTGRPATQIEKKAKEISKMDSRGVAGESFFEFPGGDIGVLASGGGASTLAMDALLLEGLNPANYTEYSGNPTKEKVAALTSLVLTIKDLRALYVVGSNANFTDIYETLSGVISAVLEKKDLPEGFVILIRRGGPRWKEAFEMIEKKLSGTSIRYKLFGPDASIIDTARELKKMLCR